MATRFLGAPVEPGPLPAGDPPHKTLRAVMEGTLRDGCVNETLSALAAARAAALAVDPEIRAHLQLTAHDEARHAALAWATFRWGLSQDPTLRDLLPGALQHPLPAGARHPLAAALNAHGILDSAQHREIFAAGMEQVVRPVMEALR